MSYDQTQGQLRRMEKINSNTGQDTGNHLVTLPDSAEQRSPDSRPVMIEGQNQVSSSSSMAVGAGGTRDKHRPGRNEGSNHLQLDKTS